MTSEMPPVVLLDANVLVKPVTRTLLMRCAPSGYVVVWSQAAEIEASRHMSGRQTPLATVRDMANLDLSASGTGAERFKDTPLTDRQILADAEAAGATFLITEDVDDFAAEDLRMAGVTAVNPDLFLAERTDRGVYRKTLEVMAAGMKNPPLTTAGLHAAIARQHPNLFGRHADLFEAIAQSTGHNPPRIQFRGTTCLACLGSFADPSPVGFCANCAT
ncbi:hypothetical protein [Myceligenerans crystallogenes]|uniref:PIN domain-containing protein n=1 Tax=Myceligenerans crystallogenes TaxID=316335 RepID=A0ABN2ND29_9MICO